MSGNNIPVFSARQFSRFGLVNLQRLSASSVGLEAVDGTAFDGLANLIEMDLARNLLTEVSYDECWVVRPAANSYTQYVLRETGYKGQPRMIEY